MPEIRHIKNSSLEKKYHGVTKLSDGALEVYCVGDPRVRCSPLMICFQPGTPEYIEIMSEIGEVDVGDEVAFEHDLTLEEEEDIRIGGEIIAKLKQRFTSQE